VKHALFRMEEDAAARVVAYFRQPSELDFDPEQRFALDWVRDHGQSLDWILSGDPGGMIARGAARQHEINQ